MKIVEFQIIMKRKHDEEGGEEEELGKIKFKQRNLKVYLQGIST